MEVYGIKPIDSGITYGANQPSEQVAGQTAANLGGKQDQGQVKEKFQEKKDLTRQEIDEATDEMNSIVKALDTDLQFKLHEKTKELMVQVVDIKSGEVLKEFPPHELLDTKAKIRDFVGALLDKKA